MRGNQRSICCLLATSVALVMGSTSDQANAQLPTTVQLPSFQTFRYQGSVLVPDGGGAFLGGNRSIRSQANRRGLSHGLGSMWRQSGASVHAQIIDLQEMDRQILGADPREIARQENARQATESQRSFDPDAEGKALVRHARKLYREDKRSESFDTYRMAISRLSPHLRDLAIKEFERGFGSAATQAVRMTTLRR